LSSAQDDISLEDALERRVEINNYYGTVKYAGELKHEERPMDSKGQVWVGVEWDDPSRGKHNGTVNSYTYFVTEEGRNAATLVKLNKVNFGS